MKTKRKSKSEREKERMKTNRDAGDAAHCDSEWAPFFILKDGSIVRACVWLAFMKFKR